MTRILLSKSRRGTYSVKQFRNPSTSGHADLYSPSLDRIKPELGYVTGNVRLILHALNSAKGSGSDEGLYHIATKLLENKS